MGPQLCMWKPWKLAVLLYILHLFCSAQVPDIIIIIILKKKLAGGI